MDFAVWCLPPSYFRDFATQKKIYLGSLSVLCYGTSLEKRLTTWPRRFSGHE